MSGDSSYLLCWECLRSGFESWFFLDWLWNWLTLGWKGCPCWFCVCVVCVWGSGGRVFVSSILWLCVISSHNPGKYIPMGSEGLSMWDFCPPCILHKYVEWRVKRERDRNIEMEFRPGNHTSQSSHLSLYGHLQSWFLYDLEAFQT